MPQNMPPEAPQTGPPYLYIVFFDDPGPPLPRGVASARVGPRPCARACPRACLRVSRARPCAPVCPPAHERERQTYPDR